ncbi:hypothetical protein PUMCH_002888 [Australozyma saopauloensis]|uniref:Squalene synthase n=1 Tax=Australozyma saopauloensis TaxID=291208 RepID=A0AAX4HAI1_9ASCO|nr:hypothetical protein PUMCH_002888 [[Candida] saopauloensis]
MGKLVEFLTHPTELMAAVHLKKFRVSPFPMDLSSASEDLRKCYEYLDLTSRSFAAVIKELHPELRDAIMLFYLVLRALDTVEDDMSIDPKIKVPVLREFHEKLNTKDWTFNGCSPTEKDRIVLENFPHLLAVYHTLKPEYQDIIKKNTKLMGNGMADYILDEQFNLNGVNTIDDYNLYCHYVAGIVGEGLTDLIDLAGFALFEEGVDKYQLANSMGNFLQKTNITRDFREDLQDGRSFYPKEIWSKYTDGLPKFLESSEGNAAGLACVNDMVLNALGEAIDVLTYLSLIREATSFNFCAIPQVMAIATLAEVYNNPEVLKRVVKIRKGTTCRLILESRTLPGVVSVFRRYVREINKKADVRDPNYLKMGIRLGEIEQFCEFMYPSKPLPKGAQRNAKPINRYIEERGSFDTKGLQLYAQETAKLRAVMFVVVAVITVTTVHLFL